MILDEGFKNILDVGCPHQTVVREQRSGEQKSRRTRAGEREPERTKKFS